MDLDLATPLAAALGIPLWQLGTYLLAILAAGPVLIAVKPRVEPVIERWRVAAALTRTTADDTGVKLLTLVWSGALLLPRLVLWLTPIMASALEAAESRKPPPRRPGGAILGVLLCGILLAGAAVTTGCGPTQAQALHSGLNETTDLVDPGYAQAVVECDLSEREVIASHAPDEGAAAAVALAVVRVRCDVAYASFEAVRGAQLALRATADAMEDGRATATDVLRSLDELAAAVESSRAFVDAIRAARGTP